MKNETDVTVDSQKSLLECMLSLKKKKNIYLCQTRKAVRTKIH